MNRWEKAGRDLLDTHAVRVRKWRTNSTGIAFSDRREIECPKPKGVISFIVLAHEVGHCVLHCRNGKYPRWREEVEAWQFALNVLDEYDLPGYERAHEFASGGIRYAFRKAVRRGVSADLIRATYPSYADLLM